ncbi:MAG: SGNH/GDSL hydrolase family protein [Polyangiaceae bacterium]|nr:SGNH/GDSL hydrolase family protein [Polyangiaceae bacterium]
MTQKRDKRWGAGRGRGLGRGILAACALTLPALLLALACTSTCNKKPVSGVKPTEPNRPAPDNGSAFAPAPEPAPDGGGNASTAAARPGTPKYFGNVVPVSQDVANSLRVIASRGAARNRRVLMKVGDSITVNCNSFCCFAPAQGKAVDLAGRTALQATIDYFNQVKVGDATPTTSWDRMSLAAAVGVGSIWPLEGGGSAPLFKEIEAINPGFAILMLGTNDNSGGTFEYYLGPRAYRTIAGGFVSMVDELSTRGIVPVITYIPPVRSDERRSWLTPAINAVLRGVATAKLVPTIDFYTPAMAIIPGGFGQDGVHPLAHPTSACLLTEQGLAYGYNVRNLVSLQVLDKVRQVVVDAKSAADPEPPSLVGDGAIATPVQIPSLPFALSVDLSGSATNQLSDYRACGLQDAASGKERVFRLTVSEGTPVRAIVAPPKGNCKTASGESDNLCGASRDVGLALFEGNPTQGKCVAWDTTRIERWLRPGTYHFVVDSFAGNDQPAYAIFSVHTCHPDDKACRP